jgi:polyphosphate kinase
MPRNFFRRVEVVYPILDAQIKERIINDIIKSELEDTVNTSELKHTGAYTPIEPSPPKDRFSAQDYFIKSAQSRAVE